ncbi:NADH dehydrogenase subunit 5 (mitochondrion) [Teleogryllus occipitalis]|uniref:NADH-ubiquinone oxidoreductase chain 5 n=1 Tax=Teleogryllus occipitalis TaxID=470939 RepID=A0A679FI20_9ORTH|nr:NADH dehydrogenase subunit 5 [Teleogryllus occipitalis]
MMSMIMFFFGLFVCVNDYVIFLDWNIVSINSCNVVMSILLDYKSLLFMSFVMYISSLVIYYSYMYMLGDENLSRFIILVLMFVLSMMFLIISPNLISILLGWDGLGLVSYCLVIYYQNVKSYNAGMITALSNRIGDVALLLSIAWMMNYGSWNYLYINNLDGLSDEMNYLIVLIILAAMTKSAQIPFSSWLPAAMAAPTPVSALVHSSTLVTAGVYLLIRFGMIIELYSMSNFVLFIGCLTMFMSGLGANFEFDLKSIIALSTLSQLGLMMSTIGLGYYDLAFFHLLTHALFKALLFMCAGVIIHGFNDLQDIRGMGGIINQMPLTSVCFLISNLALCGMPFLSGFYSKDLILELSLMGNFNLLIFMLFFLSTGLTVCYTFRLIYYVVVGEFNFKSMHCLGDENYGFVGPMFMLVLMSVIGGSLMSWVMIYTPVMICLPFYMKILALMVSLIGGWMGFELSLMVNYNSFYFNKSYLVSFLGSMWFMPYISTYMISSFPLYNGLKIVRVIDCGWSEKYGGQGMFMYLYKMSMVNQEYQFNYFKYYLLSFMFWVFIFMMFLIYTTYYLNSLLSA